MTPSPQQRALIEAPERNVLGLAGPGSGKTRTMIWRIERLLKAPIDAATAGQFTAAAHIACVTFTNAAAEEIRNRLKDAGIEEPLGYVGTLHGLALRTLQAHGTPLGYGPRINILDEATADELLLSNARTCSCKAGIKKLKEVRREFVPRRKTTSARTKEELAVVSYLNDLRRTSSVDFDSLLEDFAHLLEAGHPSPQWEHLIVDEVQDSSDVDWRIYNKIPARNLFLIGDTDQAIYGFRGGNVHQAEALTRDPRWKTYLLEGNYRCAPAICVAANSLISHQPQRVDKWTVPSMSDGPMGAVVIRPPLKTADEEATVTVDAIRHRMNEGQDPSTIAVLGRTHNVVRTISSTAEAVGIPIRRKHLRRMPADWDMTMAFLEFLHIPGSNAAALRLMRAMDGHDAAETARAAAVRAMRPVAELLQATLKIPDFSLVCQAPQMLARARASRESIALVERWIGVVNPETIGELLLTLQREGFEEVESGVGVTFATLHAAKGREWNTVYLVGWEQETIPGRRAEEIEEERRLAYVGVTRAQENLFISHALSRREPFGVMRISPTTASQFLTEVRDTRMTERA